MANDAIHGYGQAIFAVARAEGIEEHVEDQLFRFARTMEQDIRLRDAIVDPGLPVEHRQRMVEELLGGRVQPLTLNIISFVISQDRARELPQIIDALVEVSAAERAKSVAEVRTAVPLGEAERQKLRDSIQRATGKSVELKVLVDPTVVGGLLVRVGDLIFDGTVRRRLQMAKERLSNA
jgi:F-type H+-transporting ATPase subunit delta